MSSGCWRSCLYECKRCKAEDTGDKEDPHENPKDREELRLPELRRVQKMSEAIVIAIIIIIFEIVIIIVSFRLMQDIKAVSRLWFFIIFFRNRRSKNIWFFRFWLHFLTIFIKNNNFNRIN